MSAPRYDTKNTFIQSVLSMHAAYEPPDGLRVHQPIADAPKDGARRARGANQNVRH